MAKELSELPPAQSNGGRSSAWRKYADGKIWELHVYDDLGYSLPAIDIGNSRDDYDGVAQTKAQNSARRWAANNGYHVTARRQQRDKIVVMFTKQPTT